MAEPKTYTHYDKQYLFDDLRRDTDAGFVNYLSTLKRGDKNSEELWDAYSNMMAGLEDGTITFENGRFRDALGRYENGVYYDSEGKRQTTNKKSKDYYGLVASYISKNLGKSKEYRAETSKDDSSKIKWEGNKSLGRALVRQIFNSDTGNASDFIGLDKDSTQTSERVKEAKRAMQVVYDKFDDLFTGYKDADQAKQYISEAIAALDDDTIDSQDYLKLSRAFGGVDWHTLFSNGKQQTQQTQQQTQQQQTQQQQVINKPLDFITWRKDHYPVFTGDLSPVVELKYNSNLLNKTSLNNFRTALGKVTDQGLLRMVNSAIKDPNYKFDNEAFLQGELGPNYYNFGNSFGITEALYTLRNRNLLKQFEGNPNLYYIPNSNDDTKNTAWVWNSSNNTINEMRYDDIPYWRQKIQDEYNQTSGNTDSLKQYYKSKGYIFKDGGVLKGQSGLKWYSKLQDYDPSKYNTKYDTNNLIIGDYFSTDLNPWISNVTGSEAGKYKPSNQNKRDYAQGIENQNAYQSFTKDLLNENGNFTDTGLKWAQAVDKLLPSDSKASFFDENGKLRTSWTVTNKDVYGRDPHTFNNLKDYLQYVRNDQIIGARHNVFGKTGTRYFYKDEAGQKHYVDPSVIGDYNVSTEGIVDNTDPRMVWTDYELTGLKTPDKTPTPAAETPAQIKVPGGDDDSSDDSFIQPTSEQQKRSQFSQYGADFLPDLIGLGRMAYSIRSNNRISKILRESLNPVLKDTYERYSPVTGAFSEMQLRNRQAADLRRNAARPFTSDASLQLAGNLDANRQSRDLEYQGFIADDKEIKRTQQEALARQEDNMARRSEVANYNRAAINQTNRERAELEATRRQKNWQSVDNFLQGVESNLTKKIATDKTLRQNTSSTLATTEYSNAVQSLQQKYLEKGVTMDKMLTDRNYLADLVKLRSRYQYDMYNIGLGRYLKNPYANGIPADYNVVLRKKGGILKPSTMYLINKVINNANNS